MSEISEQLTVTFDELFQAISELENHTFINDQEYIQAEHIQIETENGYTDVGGLIKKTAPLLEIILDDGRIIKCADKHILFDTFGEKYASAFKTGDLVKTTTGYSSVISVKNIAEIADVFDLEVKNSNHQYVTSNGVVHHNTSVTAGISHLYGLKGYKIITIVPSGDLVSQTREWYELLGLDVGEYSGECKDLNHTHIVATWQAIQYNPSIMQEFQVLIWDECFSAATRVLMADMTWKSIAEVQVGDSVMSMAESGEFEAKPVTHCHHNLPKSHSSKMLRLTLSDGSCIEVTENHEFFTHNRGKVAAKDLTPDDDLCEFSVAAQAQPAHLL